MRWPCFIRDERVLGTSRIKTVPDYFSALTNQPLWIFVRLNERHIESSTEALCWWRVAVFRAGIRVIWVTGGWFCVCCPVNWESRSAQHTLPSAKGQLRVFACPTVPGPLEFGSHWNISLCRISQGIQRESCVLYWGQPAFWFLCWLWELCYNLLSEQVSWERALLVMCW